MKNMPLSDAIRLGSMLGPQLDTEPLDGAGGSCALGAAVLATGVENIEELHATYTWTRGHVECPVCGLSTWVRGLIPHLNNKTLRPCDYGYKPHGWTREQIADWVATLESKQGTESATTRGAVPVAVETPVNAPAR